MALFDAFYTMVEEIFYEIYRYPSTKHISMIKYVNCNKTLPQ